jgi:hypothetical protein
MLLATGTLLIAVGSPLHAGVGRLVDEEGDFCGQQSYVRRCGESVEKPGP